jgi:hypothetical protein
MPVTAKIIEKLDELVERADYGGRDDDMRLANMISAYWPDLEPILRSAANRVGAGSSRQRPYALAARYVSRAID